MDGFRRRPLTWLFLIATACVDLAAVATGHETAWFATLVVGQVMVAGGWLALGRAHRLARVGVFMGVMLALAAPDFFLAGVDDPEWRYVLGTLLVIGVATAVSAGALLLLMKLFGVMSPTPHADRWRYSVVEMLGWMIIVAAGTVTVQAAVFSHLEAKSPRISGHDPNWVDLSLVALVAATMMAVRLRLTGIRQWIGVAITAGVLFILAGYLMTSGVRGLMTAWGAYAYVFAWIIVVLLDEPRTVGASSIADEQRTGAGGDA
jgi:hypothetical protein